MEVQAPGSEFGEVEARCLEIFESQNYASSSIKKLLKFFVKPDFGFVCRG